MKRWLTILAPGFLVLFALVQAPLIKFGPGTRTLGANRENMETPLYVVGPFGWFAAAIFEAHGGYYYPTPKDYNPPGFFCLLPSNGVAADFNGDGREDLLITWAISPHTIERKSRATFTILLNEGNGRLRYAPEMFEGGSPPLRHFAYRTAVADFNGDGRLDIVAASSGMMKRNKDGSYTMGLEPIPLAMSTPGGNLRDASADIEGQENGGLPAGVSGNGHDMSVGDVNGDGKPDFYTQKLLFLNDGSGKFLNATQQLPKEMRPDATFIMTSSIGDLDGDGIGDIVAAYSDGDAANLSGYIMLSDGHFSLQDRPLIAVPPGRYGAGVTKFNNSVIMDVDQDGRNDIVFHVTRSNPYYLGRTIQVLMNRGHGRFVDETGIRVKAPANLDTAPGEATLHVVDVDRDGVKDLVLSAQGPWLEKGLHGITVYLDGGGVLRAMEHSDFPWVQPWQMAGEDDMREHYSMDGMGRAYPIDLDGRAAIDFVSNVGPPIRRLPQVDPNELYFYSILSKPLLITSPNGGQVWRRNGRYNIKWKYSGAVGTRVKIELLKGRDAVLNRTIIGSAPIGAKGSGYYKWKVPADQSLGGNFKIRITSRKYPSYLDSSDKYLKIDK